MSKRKQVLVIDSQLAGISGDMLLGSFIDLGTNAKKVKEAIMLSCKKIPGCRSIDIVIKDVDTMGFSAKKVDIINIEKCKKMTGIELKDVILKSGEELGFKKNTKQLANSTIDVLLKSEKLLHGTNTLKNIHLHELGSVDTIVDIIGTFFALEQLGLDENVDIYSLPVALGGGIFSSSHGLLPSPSPVALEILRSKKFRVLGGPTEQELCTPTGASILVNLAKYSVDFMPPFTPFAIGYGAGSKKFKEMPNILRLILGESSSNLLKDHVMVLESNIDDRTGEQIGYIMNKLEKEGAKSVSIIPMYTKRNRPGQIIQIITDLEKFEYLTNVLMEETGTLGVRIMPCERRILVRNFLKIKLMIDGKKYPVSVKIAMDKKGKVFNLKPEYDDISRIAFKTDFPLRKISELATEKAIELLKTQ